jgi:hypothetical protein
MYNSRQSLMKFPMKFQQCWMNRKADARCHNCPPRPPRPPHYENHSYDHIIILSEMSTSSNLSTCPNPLARHLSFAHLIISQLVPLALLYSTSSEHPMHLVPPVLQSPSTQTFMRSFMHANLMMLSNL